MMLMMLGIRPYTLLGQENLHEAVMELENFMSLRVLSCFCFDISWDFVRVLGSRASCGLRWFYDGFVGSNCSFVAFVSA